MGLIVKTGPRRGKLEFTPEAQKKLQKNKIKSFSEAKVKLESVYCKEIARAKVVAKELALKHGAVGSRDVMKYMIAEGSFTPHDENTEHWISMVWIEKIHGLKRWKHQGAWQLGKSTKTQGGDRSAKVWVLNKLPWE